MYLETLGKSKPEKTIAFSTPQKQAIQLEHAQKLKLISINLCILETLEKNKIKTNLNFQREYHPKLIAPPQL